MLKLSRHSTPLLIGSQFICRPFVFRTATTLAQQQTQIQPEEEPVLIHEKQGARYITLNRPRVLNAMNIEMVDTFFPYLQAWEKSAEAKMIFLKGNGRALCAGGDVKALLQFLKRKDQMAIKVLDKEYKMFHYVATMKKPYIALMDGITMGAGGGLSVNAPFRIATENTQFAMPETAIGHFPDVGAAFFLSRLDGYIGTYLGMTGHTIKSHDVLYSGLATHFVPARYISALETRLIELNTSDHDTINETINEFAAEHIGHRQRPVQDQHFTLRGEIRQTIDKCFRHDKAEDIVSALEQDGSAFAKTTRDTILKRPPTSVKVTLELLRSGIHMGVADCMKMEYKLWQKLMTRHDFTEGVTSQLVTRQPPQWKPARLTDIDDTEMKRMFFDTPAPHPLEMLNNDNYVVHPYQRFALPLEKEILDTLAKNPTWQQADLTRHFVQRLHDKFGVMEKVADVWNRRL